MIAVTDHLTEEQLRAYSADALPRVERQQIGRHLLSCEKCLKKMPVPTPEQFLAAIFREDDEQNDLTSTNKTVVSGFRTDFVQSLLSRPTLAWSGAAAIVLCFSFVGWWLFAVQEQTTSVLPTMPAASEVATEDKPVRAEQTELTKQTSQSPQNNQISNVEDDKPANQIVAQNNPKKPAKSTNGKLNEEKKSRNVPNAIVEANRNNQVSNTNLSASQTGQFNSEVEPPNDEVAVLRSGDNGFAPNQSFSLIFPVQNQVVSGVKPEFRWQNVPGAKSYQITVFDDRFNPVVVATVKTSKFKLDKPLEPGKIYLWRVAAVMSNGEEIIAPRPPQAPIQFRVVK